ncbi:DUF4258 domain-containing protein [Vibrio sonorensis]|uniref:DUF4258 domain-containing protein n=1 Tax=Vibrio sonorensis TaxID=1004316 RepID=UPI0008DAE2DD|nr:DUF4258 domain-containing protein [Vibrio sonorensis]
MTRDTQPLAVAEFPLTPTTARRIVRDLATSHTGRIKLSKHARQRMKQRDITILQVMNVLKSRSNRFQEPPFERPDGNWQMNIEGVASGSTLRIPLVLRRHEDDPTAFVLTLINIK